jgi:hypothetical protein
MLTRSKSKQTNLVTSVTRSTRTSYYLRNLQIINYYEAGCYKNDYREEYNEIDFSYNNDDMPGPYDDIGPWCGSKYCDYCGYGCYDGYDGYDN